PCIHYIWSPRDPASTYLVSPGPCIHYNLVSPNPASTISGLPGPCIHYIWSFRTLHPLYLVSHNRNLHISVVSALAVGTPKTSVLT
ncbi:unnamed protein product, partial [Staurois parvus]